MTVKYSGHCYVPNTDLLSFTLGDPQYDLNKPLFIDPRDPTIYHTYRTATDLIRRLIAGFHADGLQQGDVVCIHAFNSITYPLLTLAVIGAGGIALGTNPRYSKGELQHALRVAKVKYLFAEPELLPNVEAAIKAGNQAITPKVFVFDNQFDHTIPAPHHSWQSLLNDGVGWWYSFNDEHTSSHTTAQLYFSAGTTGLPKCAMISHRNLVAAHQAVHDAEHRGASVTTLLSMPFFHIGIMPTALVSVLKEGRSAYVMRDFQLESFLRFITNYEVMDVMMTPPMVSAVVNSNLVGPHAHSNFSLKSLRRTMIGGAPLSAETERRFRSLLSPDCVEGQAWEMTEMTGTAITARWSAAALQSRGLDDRDVSGSVGEPVRGTIVKLVDDLGADVTERGWGELRVRGPSSFLGYFDDEAATRKVLDSEGFLKTGDIFRIDEKTGYLYVVDRREEFIKVHGLDVAPTELEDVLCEHPGVLDAAVIGIHVGEDLEAARAYVAVKEGAKLSEQDVHKHMRQRLAAYKQLTGGVVFVDSLPRSMSGTLLRRVIREAAKKELGGAFRARL